MTKDGNQGLLLAALAAAAGAGAWALHKRSQRRSGDYDDLEGVVSFSSRLVAAMRAMEDREEGRLIVDPLAAQLAGPAAMKMTDDYFKSPTLLLGAKREGVHNPDKESKELPPDLAAKYRRKYGANHLAVRTWWFDTQLEQALERAHAAAGSGKRRRQVVLLGAGMDTRAWRHAFLQGVAWFEVDRADVLAAKDHALRRARAQPTETAVGDWRYPLQAGSRATLEADLNHRGWVSKLQAAGFDPKAPTVWIAEGLLMYLQPEAVANLLQEAAAASAPGSTLLTQALSSISRTQADVQNATLTSLRNSFTWFCEEDPAPLFREHGWAHPEVTSYSRMAADTGRPKDFFAAEMQQGSDYDTRAPFIAATL